MPKNLARKASNSKKQTRLRFDAVDPSSSPSPTSGMSPANVRYTIPGNKRAFSSSLRKVTDSSESDDILSAAAKDMPDPSSAPRRSTRNMPSKALPTPVKSSQPQFPAPAGSSDDGDTDTTAAIHPPSFRGSMHKKKTTSFLPRFEAYKRRSLNDAQSSRGSDPEERAAPTPSKKPTNAKQPKEIVKLLGISSDSDEDADIPAVKQSTPKKAPLPLHRHSAHNPSSKPVTITLSESDDDFTLPLPRSNKGSTLKSKKHFQSSSLSTLDQEDEDDEDPIISSPKRSQRPPFRTNQTSKSNEEEDDDIQSSIIRPRRPVIVASLDEDIDDVISPLKRRRAVVESESESDVVESPLKRRRAEPLEDSDSDLPFPTKLASRSRPRSESPSRVTRQARPRRHRTAKEKILELLKRKRAGENIEKLTDTESSDSEDDGNEPVFEKLSEFEDDDEEEVVRPKRKAKERLPKEDANPDADQEEDDEDFIVDDDEDDPLGVPMHSIPLEFTHQAHKPLKEHFRDAIEWMVHNKINPAFARNDPVYDQAFRKLESECSGLAKSKFSSTQWTRDFTTALYSRPVFISGDLEEGEGIDLASGRPKCDACNHRSHVPSKFIQFQGKPYDNRTLEELDQGNSEESDEQDSDESDCIEVNGKGQEVPSEDTKWFVGRHCYANAEQSHTLIHWKFALYEWVKDTLESEGELVPTKLAEREKMKARKRTDYANTLVDRWTAENQIKDLYRDFKNQVSTARELQQGKRGAWV